MSFKNELPNISILTPTYNRSKFLPLFIHNVKNQTYPHNKLEVCIYDDGTEPFTDDVEKLREELRPIKLVYHRDKVRKTIGEKRNYLCKKLSRNKVMCFMDDDDIYSPIYIEYSYDMLKENKAGLVGSNSMIFTYPYQDYKITAIKCKHKIQIHENTMLFTRRYFGSMGGFEKSSQGEGARFIQDRDKDVFITDIFNVLINVGHGKNTIDKEQFNRQELKLEGWETFTGPERLILNKILDIK